MDTVGLKSRYGVCAAVNKLAVGSFWQQRTQILMNLKQARIAVFSIVRGVVDTKKIKRAK